jgi:hypothetical protein
MDLVVLVAELAQDNDKSYKDLDKELMMRGYSQDEIERAVVWYATRDDVPEDDQIIQHGRNSFRVLSDWEPIKRRQSHRLLRCFQQGARRAGGRPGRLLRRRHPHHLSGMPVEAPAQNN